MLNNNIIIYMQPAQDTPKNGRNRKKKRKKVYIYTWRDNNTR